MWMGASRLVPPEVAVYREQDWWMELRRVRKA
jgi:hypothetical protein